MRRLSRAEVSIGTDAQHLPFEDLARPLATLHLDERLEKGGRCAVRSVAHVDDGARTALVPQQHRRRVLPGDAPLHRLVETGDRVRLPHEKTGEIEHLDPTSMIMNRSVFSR